MTTNKENKPTRINLILDEETDKKVSEKAKELGLKKPQVIRVIINEYMKQEEYLKNFQKIQELLQVEKESKKAGE